MNPETQVIDAQKELEKLIQGGAFDERIKAALRLADEARGKEREELQKRIATLEAKYEAAKESQKTAESWKVKGLEVADPKNASHFRKGVEKFSVFRYIKTLVTSGENGKFNVDLSDCGLELEVRKHMQELAVIKASQNVGASSAGGALVPIEVQSELIPDLLAQSIASRAGVRTMTGLVGNMSWVRQETGVTGGYLDTEAEDSISEETITFGTVTASPKPLGAAVGITWLAMRQPAISMEALVRQDIVARLALLKDNSIFRGSGAQGIPRGIANWPGINSVAWGTTGITYGGANDETQDLLRQFIHKLREDNALGNGQNLAWVMEPDATLRMETIKDADGRGLYVGLNEPQLKTLLSYPTLNSTVLDTGDDEDAFFLFGKFDECFDANWGTIELDVTNSHASDFLKGRVVVRAIMQHDVAVRQPECFALATDFDAVV